MREKKREKREKQRIKKGKIYEERERVRERQI